METQTQGVDLDALLEQYRNEITTQIAPDPLQETLEEIPVGLVSLEEKVIAVDETTQKGELINTSEKAPKTETEIDEPTLENDIDFDTAFRGFNRQQVQHYIAALTKDYNAICQKCAKLEQKNDSLTKALIQLQNGASE